MAVYEVEYASFTKVRFEAEDQDEADTIASIMEGEEIEEKGQCDGYVIWNDPAQVRERNYTPQLKAIDNDTAQPGLMPAT